MYSLTTSELKLTIVIRGNYELTHIIIFLLNHISFDTAIHVYYTSLALTLLCPQNCPVCLHQTVVPFPQV